MADILARDFSSVDRRARMKLESRGLPLRPAKERVRDFDEPITRLDDEWAVHEASRCIHCPDPAPCHRACPAGNDISYTMWLIENGQFAEAAQVYRQTNSLSEIQRAGYVRLLVSTRTTLSGSPPGVMGSNPRSPHRGHPRR